MSCGRVLLVLAVLLGGVAYYLYTPFPDDAIEPGAQMKMTLEVMKIFVLCDIKEFLGFSTFAKCSRNPYNKPPELDKDLSDKDLKVSDELFDGVKVRLYVPRSEESRRYLPGIVYIHGGGWVLGSVEGYDALVRTFATSLPAVIASVDYRLAPEHPFPVPFEDCVKATRFFMQNARTFDVDASRVAVAGDSAGGNLAMAVGAKLTDDRQPPRVLGLIYPALQMADFQTPSYITYTSMPYVLKSYKMAGFYLMYAFGSNADLYRYLANEHVSDKIREAIKSKVNINFLPAKYNVKHSQSIDRTVDKAISEKAEAIITNKYLCPLMLDDDELYELPKSYLLTCEYDPLRDDGLMLAKRWKDMAFPVKHVHYERMQHGFFHELSLVNLSKIAVEDFIDYLKAEL